MNECIRSCTWWEVGSWSNLSQRSCNVLQNVKIWLCLSIMMVCNRLKYQHSNLLPQDSWQCRANLIYLSIVVAFTIAPHWGRASLDGVIANLKIVRFDTCLKTCHKCMLSLCLKGLICVLFGEDVFYWFKIDIAKLILPKMLKVLGCVTKLIFIDALIYI